MKVVLENLTKKFQNRNRKDKKDVIAVDDFNLEIPDGKLVGLLGPSGCGKSTMLYMISGLLTPTEGKIYFGENDVTKVPTENRGVGLVFQNYALYPHMSVFDNMAFGLKLRKTPKEEIKRKVEEAARILDIEHLLDRKPKALSGGQKQRVALGRAIVRDPKVFLLDEPLSNLDAKLRATMRTELTKIHKKLGTTFIYVTHDQVEAMTMATRIVVMKDGYIQQVDTPQNLYDNPVNIFVAGFIGTPQMNFINAKLEKRGGDVYVIFGENALKLPENKANDPALKEYIGQEVVAGIRPECIHDEPMFLSSMPDSIISADVEVTELMGAEIYLYLVAGEQNLVARVSPRSTARSGDTIQVAFDMSRMHLFDKDTEKCIIH